MLREGINKLKKMSAAEIRFRSKQKIRIGIEKLHLRISGNGEGANVLIPREIGKASKISGEFPDKNIQFFGLSGDAGKIRDSYQETFSSGFSQTVDDADKLLKHKFHFLGEDFNLSNPVDWNRNPVTGNLYPHRHYSTIRTKDTETYGDIKYLWELNRHQFFIELGKAYLLTGDEKYAWKIRDWIESWIETNPYKMTVNWTSALESAVRIFSWIWTFYFTRSSGIWSTNFKMRFLRNLLSEGTYISENLSYYFSPYNHLIGELAALSFLGTIFPELPGCANWREKHWNEMETQIDRQFHPDGFTVEQAAYYHHFTLGFYLMVALLRRQNNLPVSDSVWEKLEYSLEIIMHMTRPDGHLPMIGDIDNARSIYFYFPKDQWNLRAFLALGAVIFDRGDMKYIAGNVSEEVLWLLGSKGLEKYRQLASYKPESFSKAFSNSGYFTMRDDWGDKSNYCCFDCGEIAHGVHKDDTSSAAHGHADILSFEISIEGKPIIIDPGFHTYFGAEEWHRYFRSTEGHNLITVDDCGQAQHEGRISWSKVSSPELHTWFSCPRLDFVGGAIDRFTNLESGIFHRRFILFRKPFYFLIMDEVIGKEDNAEERRINSYLHFSPGELAYKDCAAYRNRNKILQLAFPEGTRVEIESGGERPRQGWIAKGYGYRSAAPVLRMETRSTMPARFGMFFPTGKWSRNSDSFSIAELPGGITQYAIKTKAYQEVIYLNPSKHSFEVDKFRSIKSNARCLVLRYDAQGIQELHCVQLDHLSIGEDKIATDQLSGISLDFHGSQQYSIKEWKQ